MKTEQKASNRPPDIENIVARVDKRLNIWNFLWLSFVSLYFILGTTSVALSAIAATDILEPKTRQWFSVGAAVCVALLGFLRPEVRFRNIVRAWRELDVAKSRFLWDGTLRTPEFILAELERTERLASDDEHQSPDSRPPAKP